MMLIPMLNSGFAAEEEILRKKVKSINLELDEDIADGIQRLRDTLCFPIDSMISESLRPCLHTFLQLAELHERSKLPVDWVPEMQKSMETLIAKTDVAKSKFDKEMKKAEIQNRSQLRQRK